jgi:hypothetical protein
MQREEAAWEFIAELSDHACVAETMKTIATYACVTLCAREGVGGGNIGLGGVKSGVKACELGQIWQFGGHGSYAC